MDEESGSAKDVAGVMKVVGAMVAAAGDTPEAKQAARNLGQAAVTVTKAVNNCLIPIAAVNFAFDKARAYFNGRFEADLKSATHAIPEDQLVEPKAFVAAPVLQGLAFSHEEKSLRDLYLALLATAMDARNASRSHPAYVEIVKQLSPFEAKYVNVLLKSGDLRAIVRIILQVSTTDQIILHDHTLSYEEAGTGRQMPSPDIPALVTNLIRLGLFEVDYSSEVTPSEAYVWAKSRPEFLAAKREHAASDGTVAIVRGIFRRTPLGLRFAEAVGIVEAPSAAPQGA